MGDTPDLHQFDHNRFRGITNLYGSQSAEKIALSKVMVVGLGGVGSWVAESLVRSGVSTLTLVDLDDVCITNSNRQVQALSSAIGKAKVDVLGDRLQDISPNMTVHKICDFFTPTTSSEILNTSPSLVIDAIDSLHSKVHLLKSCWERRIDIITVGGAGGKANPQLIEAGDLAYTQNDKLLKAVRRQLREDGSFESQMRATPCVYSKEKARLAPGRFALETGRLDCSSNFGTSCFVTGSFGFMASYLAMKLITGHQAKPKA